jgi:hypothetical protein
MLYYANNFPSFLLKEWLFVSVHNLKIITMKSNNKDSGYCTTT